MVCEALPPHTTTVGQSRAVSVRMNPELLHELHTAADRHVPISTLIREATANTPPLTVA